jgi:Right handed beta helix region
MSSRQCARLLSIVLFALGLMQLQAATITNVVGTCKPGKPSFTTISAALATTPPPDVVQVCPNTYNEQIVITQPVILEGLSNGNAGQAIVAPPIPGAVVNAADGFGDAVAAQIWVNNVIGEVTISDLTIDGTTNGLLSEPDGLLVGIFSQNTALTVNRVVAENQKDNKEGIGIFVEGGSSDPSVTLENSSIHDFDHWGIIAETNSSTSPITATIKDNTVDGGGSLDTGFFASGIFLDETTVVEISGNHVSKSLYAIDSYGLNGVISNNTLTDNAVGVNLATDGVSVESNTILDDQYAIALLTAAAVVKNNHITNASEGGIDFGCYADPNVHSNIITDAFIGVKGVPAVVSTTNTYFGVATIRGGC